MKKIQALTLAVLLLLGTLLTGCGSRSSSDRAAEEMGEAAYDGYYEEYDEYWPAEYATEAYAVNGDAFEQSVAVKSLSAEPPRSSDVTEAKIIYTASLRMEALAFDEALDGLAALTAGCGGYYEYSSVNNGGGVRSADLTVRVPAEKYRQFMDSAGALCHILSVQEHTEDVSESYYDTEGRVQTQKVKLQRLQQLLEQAEYMEDIIVLEDAISETEENIDRLTGQLRHYDALVDYSTVEIYLVEVKEMTVIDEEEPTFSERMSAAFSEGWESFSESMEDVAVFFAGAWQWLLIAAIIVVVIVLIVRRAISPKPKKDKAIKKTAAANKIEQKSASPESKPDDTSKKE